MKFTTYYLETYQFILIVKTLSVYFKNDPRIP